MATTTTEFTIEFEGDTIPVIITEEENGDETTYHAQIPDYPAFEIFISEDELWATNDDVDVDEDLIFLIGEKFEELQD